MPPDWPVDDGDVPGPPRHRPLAPVVAGLALGIALDGLLRPSLTLWWLLLAVTVPLCAWGLRRGLKPWGYWALAVFLLAPVGGLRHGIGFRHEPAEHFMNLALDGADVYHVRGRVQSEPESRYRWPALTLGESVAEEYWLLRVDIEGLSSDGEDWRPAAGGLTVFVRGGPPAVGTGQGITFIARPQTNRPPTNPGQRDDALAFARMGSHGVASVDSPEAVRVVGPARLRDLPGALIGRGRARLQRRLAAHLEGDDRAGLAMALLFGRRDALTPDQRTLLRESGTLHFLAISGLHVGLFCVFVGFALAFTGLAPGVRLGLTVALVWGYVLFVGAPISAVRAAWMITFLLMAPVLRRRRDPLSALAGAALLILLVRPQALFMPGFQLTVVAVWSMASIYPQLAGILWPWEDLIGGLQRPEERTVLGDVWRWGRSYLLLCCVVWAATAPIRAWHFNSLCAFGPLLNLLVWPLVLLLLLACFALGICLLVLPWAVGPALWAVGLFSGNIEALLDSASRLPGFGVYMTSPPGWWVVLYYVALGAWTLRHRLPAGRKLFLTAAAVLALSLVVNDAAARFRRDFSLTVPDVGMGQAALLQTRQGQAVLLDAGSMRQTAQQTVAELLWHRRAGPINAAVLSHLNRDHYAFLPYLARRFTIEEADLPSEPTLTPTGAAVRRVLAVAGLRLRHLREGGALSGGGLACRVLHPDPRFASDPSQPVNERSLVLHGSYEGLTFLAPGDIESSGMRHLSGEYGGRLKADVLIMPHHGHYHDGLAEFVAHVDPAVAVVSGRAIDFDARTAAVLAARGTSAWITGIDGAIIVTLEGGRGRVTGWATGRTELFDLSGSMERRDDGRPSPQGR